MVGVRADEVKIHSPFVWTPAVEAASPSYRGCWSSPRGRKKKLGLGPEAEQQERGSTMASPPKYCAPPPLQRSFRSHDGLELSGGAVQLSRCSR